MPDISSRIEHEYEKWMIAKFGENWSNEVSTLKQEICQDLFFQGAVVGVNHKENATEEVLNSEFNRLFPGMVSKI